MSTARSAPGRSSHGLRSDPPRPGISAPVRKVASCRFLPESALSSVAPEAVTVHTRRVNPGTSGRVRTLIRLLPFLIVVSLVADYATPYDECAIAGATQDVRDARDLDQGHSDISTEIRTPEWECEELIVPGSLPTTWKAFALENPPEVDARTIPEADGHGAPLHGVVTVDTRHTHSHALDILRI